MKYSNFEVKHSAADYICLLALTGNNIKVNNIKYFNIVAGYQTGNTHHC